MVTQVMAMDTIVTVDSGGTDSEDMAMEICTDTVVMADTEDMEGESLTKQKF